METVVLTIHLLLALALIVVVLLQRSEGGGLGIGGGGGGGGVLSGRSTATALSKLTWILGIAFVATSLTLTMIASQKASTSSVIDGLSGAEAPAANPAATPELGQDLLPPIPVDEAQPSGDGPAVPPPIE